MPRRTSPDDIQHVRATADFYRASMYAQANTAAAVAGAYSFVLLLNNMPTGEFLHVTSVSVWVNSPTASCYFARTTGALGGSPAPPAIALSPNAPTARGQLFAGSYAPPNLTPFYRLSGNAMPDSWQLPFPAAILATGNSLVLYASLVNTSIEAGLTWMIMPSD